MQWAEEGMSVECGASFRGGEALLARQRSDVSLVDWEVQGYHIHYSLLLLHMVAVQGRSLLLAAAVVALGSGTEGSWLESRKRDSTTCLWKRK